MGRGIYLSKKHGVNPAIPLCFYCLEPKNEIVLPGRMKGDAQAPQHAVWDDLPCDKCREHMKNGIILISVDEKLSGGETTNPYRTGGWVVIKEDAIRRMIDPESAERILRLRFSFVTDETWDMLGLPRPEPLPAAANGDTDG